MELKGRVVLVTGGATGLGREISLDLAKQGMSVVVNYSRSEQDAKDTVEQIQALGGEAFAIRADVSTRLEVNNMVDSIIEKLGRLDAIVANAGTTVFRAFEDIDGVSEEDWDRIMNVNVKGAWLLAKAATPYMKKQGAGRIVITTSVAGIRPTGSSLPYSVSKAAAIHLTKGLAKGLGPEILVNAIAPGLLDTRWTRGHDPKTIDAFIKNSPLQNIPSLEDNAKQVRGLIETDSMTGSIIVVDSGTTL
ncbi:SDR family NAD(P)-dependent oxidoreductase [Ammoniphilus resinae]|uniref:3-oxoacyl-[acyl-carrier protein] reductase n=1 Tax=Ammoniphilus resinae TaxID=861532 RepID=A0ABS4GUF7_9BACL|nr:SDR family NAD(P)-dependent oxidoreductase [Ammoniphilus resinae]MBP1933899.1 3-oxoacyl-[acyl-carrier protein] reductase [Ammoniphilus resinae]